MKKLSPQVCDLLRRHILEGETYAELAAEAGCSAEAVRMVVQRACKHLRATLNRQGMTEQDANEYRSELARELRGGGKSDKKCHVLMQIEKYEAEQKKHSKITRSVLAPTYVSISRSVTKRC